MTWDASDAPLYGLLAAIAHRAAADYINPPAGGAGDAAAFLEAAGLMHRAAAIVELWRASRGRCFA